MSQIAVSIVSGMGVAGRIDGNSSACGEPPGPKREVIFRSGEQVHKLCRMDRLWRIRVSRKGALPAKCLCKNEQGTVTLATTGVIMSGRASDSREIRPRAANVK